MSEWRDPGSYAVGTAPAREQSIKHLDMGNGVSAPGSLSARVLRRHILVWWCVELSE
jgi:hypothetical protein